MNLINKMLNVQAASVRAKKNKQKYSIKCTSATNYCVIVDVSVCVYFVEGKKP